MAEYIYAREKDATGQWNIDNTQYVDGEGMMVHLVNVLNVDVAPIKFDIKCAGSGLTVITDEDLDAEQQTTVTNTIATYKAETGE